MGSSEQADSPNFSFLSDRIFNADYFRKGHNAPFHGQPEKTPKIQIFSALGSARISRLFILPTLVLTRIFTKLTWSSTP